MRSHRHLYSKAFFEDQIPGSLRSAEVVVPLVLEILGKKTKRVIDVGCGSGAWLSVFRKHGVRDVWGVDGVHVAKRMLMIPRERFITADLRKPLNQVRGRFDLVVSLEVAEHIPENRAEAFVNSLTRLSPVVLFSAAIPFQGGHHHVNEKWPDYWAGLFARKGFIPVDCIRKKIWDNNEVEFWYAQNILLFVRKDFLKCHKNLGREHGLRTETSQLSIVHPKSYLIYARIFKWLLKAYNVLPMPLKSAGKRALWKQK